MTEVWQGPTPLVCFRGCSGGWLVMRQPLTNAARVRFPAGDLILVPEVTRDFHLLSELLFILGWGR